MTTSPLITSKTIVAIATAPGRGGIGIIRLSGDDALAIAKRFLKSPLSFTPRLLHYCKLYHPQTQHLLDEACLVYFKAPHSYTGEDVVEIQTHGSPYLLQSLVECCVTNGAIMASPGEFTKRAYIHGKMDLAKAESVIDVIDSSNEKAHHVAINQLQGTLSTHIQEIAKSLTLLLEQLDGSIEFPDEVPELPREVLTNTLTQHLDSLNKLIALKDYGEKIKEGVRCVIVGSPNAGKSSLLNQLLGHQRAIVTNMPGTTRDFITADISLGGLTFQFTDTAGLRDTNDQIEQLGIAQVAPLLKKAHLIFWLADSQAIDQNTLNREYQQLSPYPNVIRVLNKSDLAPDAMWPENCGTHWPQLRISCNTQAGITPLKAHLSISILEDLDQQNLDHLCNTRQLACIQASKQHLSDMLTSIQNQIDDATLTIDLRQAILQLNELTGEQLNETIMDGVFQRFCVGK